MEKDATKSQVIKKRILKGIRYAILSILGILLTIIISFQIPAVQTYAAQKLTPPISKKVGYSITIEKLKLNWIDEIKLEGLQILDLDSAEFLFTQEAYVDFNFNGLTGKKFIAVDKITLVEPDVRLRWQEGDELLNINLFIKTIRNSFKKKKNKKPKFKPFVVNRLEVINGHFSYDDLRKPHMNDSLRFDHNHFALDSINGHAEDFYTFLDTIKLSGHHITGLEKNTKLRVHDLNAAFLYCKKSMHFDSVDCKVGQSYISDKIHFDYASVNSLAYFIDSVHVDAKLDSTVIHTQDLAYFAPPIRRFQDQWTVYGEVEGKVENFKANNFAFFFGRSSHLKSDRFDLEGILKPLETHIRVDIKDGSLSYDDASQYLSSNRYQKLFKKMGLVDFKADFRGYPTNFVAHGEFNTYLGYLDTDLQLNLSDSSGLPKYSGLLQTKEFNLGDVIEYKKLGLVTMDGSIEGEGFNKKTANILINAKIDKAYFNQYGYSNIKMDSAVIKNGFFNGHVQVDDPNLQMNIKGIFDLEKERVALSGKLDKALLKPLNFSKDSIYLKGEGRSKFRGFNLDNIEGLIKLEDIYLSRNDQSLNLKDFKLISLFKDSTRTFDIYSDLFDFQACGDFRFESILKSIQKEYNEYQLALINDKDDIKQYYEDINEKLEPFDITFEAQAKDLDPLLRIVYPKLSVSPNTEIEGLFSLNEDGIKRVDVNGQTMLFSFEDFLLEDVKVDLKSSKPFDKNSLDAAYNFSTSIFTYQDVPRIEDIEIDGYWENDSLIFNADLFQYRSTNKVNLHGLTLLKPDTILIQLMNSDVRLLNKEWGISPGNKITILKNEIQFQDLELSNLEEWITASGTLSSKKEENPLLIRTKGFRMKNLEPFLKTDIDGYLNGLTKIEYSKENVKIDAKANIKKLTVFGEEIGDIEGKMRWNNQKRMANFDVFLLGDSTRSIELVGSYDTENSNSPIKAKAVLDDTPFILLEPFLFNNAKNLTGAVDGKVNITGTFADPDFQGKVKLKNTAFTISYLNTRYNYDGPVFFDDDRIFVKKAVLTDSSWKTTATLNGGITHKMFKKFNTDVSIDLNKTYMLNTGPDDNDLYYGQAFGTGKVQITGPFSEMKIYSNQIRSEKNTKIFIPLEGTETIVEKDYIVFVNPKKEKEKEDPKLNLSGIEMDINLDITRDAEMEIIFDEKAGDIMKGNGEGNLNLQIDTRGDFNMFGNYEIAEGTYNFTLVNLINKKFDVKPNSTINWTGDPYQGQLNILATYKQFASIIPIVDTNVYDMEGRTEFNQSYPVEITLALSGALLTPEVDFDVEVTDYPSTIQDIVESFHAQVRNNTQEKNKQVFSLVVLKQLSPAGSLGNVATGSYGSLSELFSNQFSHWLSQFDENLEVDIDLSGFDEESNTNFRLRLSYSILDGKVRISQNSNFQNVENSSGLANVFGEWTIEYLITNDGKLRVKAYNKTNQNNVINDLNNAGATLYGVSLSHTTSFDNLGELFKRNPNKKEVIKEEDMEIEEEEEEIN